MNPTEKTEDHGVVVKATRRGRVSWVWLFPVLAASAAAWLFWSNWKSLGPEIEIRFAEAPGIQAGKSHLIYRGVISGSVTKVKLDEDMDTVIVSVRLKEFAAQLASDKTDFWIDQPVISLRETTGLDSIVQGNSVQARYRGGQPATTFKGLDEVPLMPLDVPSLTIRLRSPAIPFLARGTPIYHRGVAVGFVRDKQLDAKGEPYLLVILDEKHADAVKSNSRFWVVPATSFKIGQQGASLEIAGLEAIIQGGVAVEQFSPGGESVKDGTEFALSATEEAARADGPLLHITFADGQGLVAGATRITHLGQTIGLVESVELNVAEGSVEAAVRLRSGYAYMAKSDSVFTLVRPEISLEGVSGLDTLLTGSYINCEPGSAETQGEKFAGHIVGGSALAEKSPERDGLNIQLTANTLPGMGKGAPILYRGLVVGTVQDKVVDANGRPSLSVMINGKYRDLLKVNSRFWRVPATAISAGPGLLNVDIQSVAALIQGGIGFDVFEAPGSPAAPATTFELYSNEVLAAAVSTPFRIDFENGRGLLAGKTELRYRGIPVGIVDSVRVTNQQVEVEARLQAGYEYLRTKGSKFVIIKPDLSLQGVSGIETLLSGVYIECIPGTGGGIANTFKGSSTDTPELMVQEGFRIQLWSKATTIQPGAHVYYRDLSIGEVISKSLSSDGQRVLLDINIEDKYRDQIYENSRFSDVGDIQASIGFIKIRVQAKALLSITGRINMTNPDKLGEPAKRGEVFELITVP